MRGAVKYRASGSGSEACKEVEGRVTSLSVGEGGIEGKLPQRRKARADGQLPRTVIGVIDVDYDCTERLDHDASRRG